MKQRFLGAALLLLILGITGASVTQAAPATNGNPSQALEISPPAVNLSAKPGETIKTQISLRDIANTPLVVRGQANDFIASGEDGIPKILLEAGEESPYSMKSWFGPLSELTLTPKQIQNLTVTINVPANAAPGGYYSVIRFTANAPGIDTSGVALSASLGALIFMQVKGDTKELLSVADFATYDSNDNPTWLLESTPVNFKLRTKNEGNLHEQPVGQAEIKDMFGNPVGTVNINLERRNVLPGSTRRFEAPLDEAVIGKRMLFGRYTADLVVTYGANNQTVKKSISFWVVPWRLIITVVVGLVGGFFLIRFALRRYAERVISRSPRRRR